MAFLTDTFGCLFIALFFVLVLYGITLILGSQYFNRYPSDPRFLKTLVAFLLIIGTVQATTAFVWVYDTLINKYGNILALDILPNRMRTVDEYVLVDFYLPVTYVVFTQLFCFPHMVSMKNIYLTGGIFVSALTLLVTTIRTATLGRLSLIYQIRTIAIIQDVAVVICDSLITIGFCILLHHHRSGVRRTDLLITRVVIESLNRGVVLLCLAICSLVLLINASSRGTVFLVLIFFSLVYIITVLSILYSRKSKRQKFTGGVRWLSNFTIPPSSSASANDSNVNVTPELAFGWPPDSSVVVDTGNGDANSIGHVGTIVGSRNGLGHHGHDPDGDDLEGVSAEDLEAKIQISYVKLLGTARNLFGHNHAKSFPPVIPQAQANPRWMWSIRESFWWILAQGWN
ncbi:hypothetical protein K435DRAFT_842214 [Dendrothele bispora CBS 962.96]|uniref:DUF6534 domain-containing protein n=1 Tax=Dendrothele bispora (strain CBS 962.96) TaxID=1314807 RepID=A0A4S8LH57_DENBC|nr:hypothetical protein K435DRAFT_842214 [Dendrothele bispora CBS 962.96]